MREDAIQQANAEARKEAWQAIEVRDKVAGLDGWTDLGQGFWKHRANCVRVSVTPSPDTLDACAAAWGQVRKRGWVWTKGMR